MYVMQEHVAKLSTQHYSASSRLKARLVREQASLPGNGSFLD